MIQELLSEDLLQLLEELKRRQDHPSKNYSAMPVQGEFHKSLSRIRVLKGGNRSGKSRAVAQEVFWKCREPNKKIWCISAEYRTLQNGLWYHLKDLIPYWDIVHIGPKAPQHNIPTYIELKNGSVIDFISATGQEGGRQKFQSASVDYIAIDEEIEESAFDELRMRCLDRGGRITISATPIRSDQWLINLIEDKLVEVFTLSTLDNVHLDSGTVKEEVGRLSDEEKDVRVYGNVRRPRGLIYSGYDRSKHLVEPFSIPCEWPRWRILDPGLRTFAVLWTTLSPDGHKYLYRELYEHNLELSEIVDLIRIAEGYKKNESFRDGQDFRDKYTRIDTTENIYKTLIDPSSRRRLETGEEGVAAQLSERFGIDVEYANNDKRQGIELCRLSLMPMIDGYPQTRVFNTCINFDKEIKQYRVPTDKSKRESNERIDQPLKKNDHLLDCWRYWELDYPEFPQAEDLDLKLFRDYEEGRVEGRLSMEQRILIHQMRKRDLANAGEHPYL